MWAGKARGTRIVCLFFSSLPSKTANPTDHSHFTTRMDKKFRSLHKKTETSQQCVSFGIPQHWDIYLEPDLGSKAFQSRLLCRLALN